MFQSCMGKVSRFSRWTLITLLGAVAGAGAVAAEPPSQEEMWRIIQEQQKTIEELKARLETTDQKVQQTEAKVVETESKVEATADAVEQVGRADTGRVSWADRTSLGGYGELHYNNLENDGTGDDLDQVDFHRFILFVGHEFNDDLRFFSELEIEHAFLEDTDDGSSPGAVELEQAWLELDLADNHRLRGGLDILPIGIINPVHEPDTFYGVERNRVESEIIPTTWWEAGLGLNGEPAPGWRYNVVAHSGLKVPVTGGSAFRPRSGRLKVAKAKNQDLAVTADLRYAGIPGLEVGISGQYNRDITGTADNLDIDATLFSGHIDYKHSSGFGLRALYARWDMDDGPAGIGPAAFNADTLDGFYIEPAYRFPLAGSIPGELGVFARYSQYDERNGQANLRYVEFDEFVTGLNWWPHPNAVVKFDYQTQSADEVVANEFDGFNLGVGYQF